METLTKRGGLRQISSGVIIIGGRVSVENSGSHMGTNGVFLVRGWYFLGRIWKRSNYILSDQQKA